MTAAVLRNQEAGRVAPHLWDPEGDVWFVEAHGQEEAAGVPLSPVLQQRDGLVRALHVGQRPSRLLRHVDGAQQVGVQLAVLSVAHLRHSGTCSLISGHVGQFEEENNNCKVGSV